MDKQNRDMSRKRNKPSPKLQYAIDWLLGFMGDYRIPANDCIFHASRAGIKPRTLQRAKDYAGIACLWAGTHWDWVIHSAEGLPWSGKANMATVPDCQIKGVV